MKTDFKEILKGNIVIVGIGNSLRGDDALGCLFVQALKDNVKAVCIDAGSAPENYTGKIIKENPDTILIVDAVHLDLMPGEYDILKEEDIMRAGFTTHDTSPKMFMDYLKNRSKANIYMLGIQPKSVSFGENVSDEVKKTLEDLTNKMKGVLGCMNRI